MLERLAAVVEARRGAEPASSWSAKLIADPALAAKKLGEEAIETVIAATAERPEALAAESADLIYHSAGPAGRRGVSLDAVAAKLERGEGTSGVAERPAARAEARA